MSEELRQRSVGSPAARSLLLTILGEYVLPHSGEIWQETLVTVLASLGYTEQAVRQSLSRSSRDGWLRTERHGRRARVSLTDASRRLLVTGAERIYSFGQPWDWDQRWLILILRVPEHKRAVRHQLRSRLAWAGFGSLGGGIWLSPHVEREAELSAAIREEPHAEARSFIGEVGEMGDPQRLIAEAWDLDSVRDEYLAFINAFVRPRPASPGACFRQQTLLVHAWRRFPFLDPDLPLSLLPSDWPRARAHALFSDRHDHWAAAARLHLEQLDANFGVDSRAA